MDQVDETAAQGRRLADEMRRIIHRLVLVRPPAADLAAAAERAGDFADRLDALPLRTGGGEISEAGLRIPATFVERSPVSGLSNPLAPPMSMWAVDEGGPDEHVEGHVTFGPAYEGPPDHVHGGYLAAMFDELLGYAQLSPGYTGTLTVMYRKPTPLRARLRLWAAVDRVDGRKRVVRGTCHFEDTLHCEAEGLFIAPRQS